MNPLTYTKTETVFGNNDLTATLGGHPSKEERVMEITISRTNLSRMIDLCRAATDSRATHPTGRSILFTTRENKLEAYATNVALTVLTAGLANVVSAGAIVLNADRFRLLVKQMPEGGTLKLKVDGKHKAVLTCPGTKLRYQMSGTSEEDFPAGVEPPKDAKSFTFGGIVLKDGITRVRAAMGDQGRPELWGITLDTSQHDLRATALHGHKLFHLRQNRAFEHDAGSVFITEPCLTPMLALCGEQDAKLTVTATKERVFVTSGETVISAPCPPGTRPDWSEFIKAQMCDRVICRVDVDIFLQAVRSVVVAAPTSKTEGKSPDLELQVKGNALSISLTNTSDDVDAENTIDVDASEEMKIKLQPSYLVEALEVAGVGIAELRFDDSGINAPLIIVSEDGAKPGEDTKPDDTVGKIIFSAFISRIE